MATLPAGIMRHFDVAEADASFIHRAGADVDPAKRVACNVTDRRTAQEYVRGYGATEAAAARDAIRQLDGGEKPKTHAELAQELAAANARLAELKAELAGKEATS